MDPYFVVENGKFHTVLLIHCRINDTEKKRMEGVSGNFEVWRGNSNSKASIKILIAGRVCPGKQDEGYAGYRF